MRTGMMAIPARQIFGENPVGEVLRCSLENWTIYCNEIDSILTKRLEYRKTQTTEPECLVDFLFASDVYKNNITKLTNDMVMAILGSTDTSRNNSIISLCYLAKNPECLKKVRAEIRKFQEMKNLKPNEHIDPTSDDIKNHFVYLKCVIDEALRFMHPVPLTDDYIVQKDFECKGIKFKKGVKVSFHIADIHRSTEEYQRVDEFLP